MFFLNCEFTKIKDKYGHIHGDEILTLSAGIAALKKISGLTALTKLCTTLKLTVRIKLNFQMNFKNLKFIQIFYNPLFIKNPS